MNLLKLPMPISSIAVGSDGPGKIFQKEKPRDRDNEQKNFSQRTEKGLPDGANQEFYSTAQRGELHSSCLLAVDGCYEPSCASLFWMEAFATVAMFPFHPV